MSNFNKSALAIAVAAALSAPIAMAEGGDSDKYSVRVTTDYSSNKAESESEVEVERESETDTDIDYKGGVYVKGFIFGDSLGQATVNSHQDSIANDVDNVYSDNNASMDGNALENAEGNAGANVAAGDNNAQANSAALAAKDAGFVFGHGSADIFSSQDAEFNKVDNEGVRNSARIGGDAMQGAAGNIGANVAAGSSNVQSNNLALTSGAGTVGQASVNVNQMTDNNYTDNTPISSEQDSSVKVGMGMFLAGTYEGTSDQRGDVYLDTWQGEEHTGGENTGHVDVDSEAQGADGGADGEGAFVFDEAGTQQLAGVAIGKVTFEESVIERRTTNNASLGGNAGAGAAGNIGMNVASGTNNLQSNNLSMVTVGGE